MKRYIYILFSLFAVNSHAQLLYLQENYRGGVSVDGKSYYFETYLQADTINFQNTVPIGSSIKKAFILSLRFNNFVVGSQSVETPLYPSGHKQHIQNCLLYN